MLEHEIVAELLAELTQYPELRSAVHEIQAHPRVTDGYLKAFSYLKHIGHGELALRTLHVTIMVNPGHAAAHTHLGCFHLGETFPHRTARVQSRIDGPLLHFPSLGIDGRFGNQIFQYAFLRLAAKAQGLTAATPDWVGRYLFQCDEPTISGYLPFVKDEEIDVPAALAGVSSRQRRSLLGQASIHGYFADHTRDYSPYRAAFQSIFDPAPWIQPYADGLVQRLRAKGSTVIAIHIRRGDMVTHPEFWIAPVSWYVEWLRSTWGTVPAPVLYVSTDDLSVLDDFAEFRPVSSGDLTDPFVGAEYYPDWYILTQADMVAISNSTFSFTASLLNTASRHFVRPSRHFQMLVPYEPWNSPPLIERDLARTDGA